MRRGILREDEDVIQVDQHELPNLRDECAVHSTLEGCMSVHQAKGHHHVLVEPLRSDESSLLLVSLSNPQLVIGSTKVNR